MKIMIKNYLTYSISIFCILFFSLFLVNTAFSNEFLVSVENENKIIGVRALDFNRHLPYEINSLNDHLIELRSNLNQAYPGKIINIFFNAKPYIEYNQTVLPLTALIQTKKSNRLFFVKLNMYFNKVNKLYRVDYLSLTDLQDTKFEVNVSLAARKMILKDSYSNIKMIFPIGVGSFDENVLNNGVSIITPRFKTAYLDKAAAIAVRKKPRYFMKKPFLRITTDQDVSKGRTNIGFHVQPNLDRFIRAFDSHGCMRMQTNDLEMLHNILRYGPHQRLKVLVKYNLEDLSEHPFPKRNSSYKSILNIGSKDEPVYKLDKDLLVQLHRVKKEVPLHFLIDQEGDDYHGIYDYVMAWRNKEYMANAKKRCIKKNPSTATIYIFDESKYIFNDAQYTLNWENFKPTTNYLDSARKQRKQLKKAKKVFKKAQKKANKAKQKAKKVLQAKRSKEKKRIESLNSNSQRKIKDAIGKCMLKYQRKTTLSDRLYRWWVH